jgi:hypothetical protein
VHQCIRALRTCDWIAGGADCSENRLATEALLSPPLPLPLPLLPSPGETTLLGGSGGAGGTGSSPAQAAAPPT